MAFIRVLLSSALLSLLALATDVDEEDISQTINKTPITCTSALRIQNVKLRFYLNSAEMNYGSGSHQQIITVVPDATSYDSMFLIKEGYDEQDPDGSNMCRTGERIKCG